MKIKLSWTIYSFLIFICCFGGFLACYSLNMTTTLMYLVFLFFGAIGLLKNSLKTLGPTTVILFIINFGYIILSALLLARPDDLIPGVVQYIVCPMAFFAFLALNKNADLKNILRLIIFFALVNSFAGVFEFFSNRYIIPKIDAYNLDGSVRICGFTGDFISYAMVLGFGVLASFYFYYINKEKKYLLISLFMFVVLFINRSRGPLVATLISLAIFITQKNKIDNRNKFTAKRLLFVFSAILFLVLAYYFVFVSDFLLDSHIGFYIQRLRSIFIWSDMENDHTNATRIQIWIRSLEIFREHFWFGTGIGGTGIRNVQVGVTESAILKRLVELGFIGSVINGLVYLKVYRLAIHNLSNLDNNDKTIAFVFLLMSVMVVIESLVLQIDEYSFITTFFWMFLALLCNLKKKNRLKPE